MVNEINNIIRNITGRDRDFTNESQMIKMLLENNKYKSEEQIIDLLQIILIRNNMFIVYDDCKIIYENIINIQK